MSKKAVLGCLSGIVGVMGLCVVLLLVVLFTSCSFNKYIVAAGLPNPDTAFQTGSVAGYNVYVWECYQGKRIVLYNWTAEMTSRAYERQEAPCGGTTKIEQELANERKRGLDPTSFW